MIKAQSDWTIWLVGVIGIDLRDAEKYAAGFSACRIQTVEQLQQQIQDNEAFVISSKINMKMSHAEKLVQYLNNGAHHPVTTTVEIFKPIMAAGQYNGRRSIQKIVPYTFPSAIESLRREYAFLQQVNSVESLAHLFPSILALEENYSSPVGLHSGPEATGLAMIMEPYGQSLNDAINDMKAASNSQNALFQEISSGMLDILVAVHQYGLVWMDFKPQNVVVFQSGLASRQFKGIDFDHAVNAGTQLDASHGFSIRYASPEQVRSGSFIASPAQDYWSLGVMLIWIASPPGQDMYSMLGLVDDAAILSFLLDRSVSEIQQVLDKFTDSLVTSRDILKTFIGRAVKNLIQANPDDRPSSVDMLMQSEEWRSVRDRQVLQKLVQIGNELLSTACPLSELLLGNSSIPGICVIIPDPDASEGVFDLLCKPYKLYFICPISLKLGNAFTIQFTRKSLVDAAPAVRIGLSVLKLMMISLGRRMPAESMANKLRHIDRVSDSVNGLICDDMRRSVNGIIHCIDSIDGRQDLTSLSINLFEIASQQTIERSVFFSTESLLLNSDSSIETFHVKSGLRKIVSDNDGSIGWVHATAVDAFNRDGLKDIRQFMNNRPQGSVSTSTARQSSFLSNVPKPKSNPYQSSSAPLPLMPPVRIDYKTVTLQEVSTDSRLLLQETSLNHQNSSSDDNDDEFINDMEQGHKVINSLFVVGEEVTILWMENWIPAIISSIISTDLYRFKLNAEDTEEKDVTSWNIRPRKFHVGDLVDAVWHGELWYAGEIIVCNEDDTYNVRYVSGDVDTNMTIGNVRRKMADATANLSRTDLLPREDEDDLYMYNSRRRCLDESGKKSLIVGLLWSVFIGEIVVLSFGCVSFDNCELDSVI